MRISHCRSPITDRKWEQTNVRTNKKNSELLFWFQNSSEVEIVNRRPEYRLCLQKCVKYSIIESKHLVWKFYMCQNPLELSKYKSNGLSSFFALFGFQLQNFSNWFSVKSNYETHLSNFKAVGISTSAYFFHEFCLLLITFILESKKSIDRYGNRCFDFNIYEADAKKKKASNCPHVIIDIQFLSSKHSFFSLSRSI